MTRRGARARGRRVADPTKRFDDVTAVDVVDLHVAAGEFLSPLGTFRQVTLPRLAPAILAGGLLAFTFSFDDFIRSFFVSGAGTTTLPLVLTLAAIVIAHLVLRRSGQARLPGA